MRIALLTPNRWFPREHLVFLLARHLAARWHDVTVVSGRPMRDLMLPVPLPEEARLASIEELVSVARASDALWCFASWPGQLHAQLKVVRSELGRDCPPVVRYLDHATPPNPIFLQSETETAALIDRVQLLTDAAQTAYRAVAPNTDVDVLPTTVRPVPQNKQDENRRAHPLYEIDLAYFGSIEGYNASYGINAARANADAFSIVDGITARLESMGSGGGSGTARALRYPPDYRIRTIQVEQDGCRFFGRADDLVIQEIDAAGWERDLVDGYFKMVREFDCEWMLDIGSHLGVYGITGAKRYGLKVHMFEPQRRLYENAVANTYLNDVADRARAHNLAVSSKEGELTIVGDFGVLGRLREGYVGKNAPVRAVALDAYLPDLMPVTGQRIAIKIDVEGHGHEVIAGMQGIIRNNRCVMQIEKGPQAVDEQLAEKGYTLRQEIGHNQLFVPTA